MTTERDPGTRIVLSWLREDAHENAERVLLRALNEVDTTQQRRSWAAWRFRKVNTFAKLAIAAAAVVVALFIGTNLLPRTPSVGSETPSPAPLPSATPAALELVGGILDAGRYSTAPFVSGNGICLGDDSQPGCSESPADDTIRVSFTVPTGWARVGGGIWSDAGRNLPPGGAGLTFGRGGWLYSTLCATGEPARVDISTGTTVAEFVDALVAHPDLDVTAPTDVTLAGYSGKYLELQAPDNIAANQDSPAQGECAYYSVWEPGIYAQGPNHLWHIWVLDVEGTRVVVRSDTYPGTPPAVQAELSAIVQSIVITP